MVLILRQENNHLHMKNPGTKEFQRQKNPAPGFDFTVGSVDPSKIDEEA